MSDTPLETLAFERLRNNDNCEHFADNWIDEYRVARTAVYNLLNSGVPAAEPDLTDHTEKHVRDVLRTAHELLDGANGDLRASDLMALVCTILYHDVGNVIGREEHWKKIVDVFNETWPQKDAERPRLRQIVTLAGGAHAGKADDGSDDTLKDVSPVETGQFNDKIRLRTIAAVTRFADELAEGPQRTNRYMRTHNLIGKKSSLYHKYSSITNIRVDRGNGRIVLTYDIDVGSIKRRKLKKLLKMAYSRVWKLNWERQLARHYCDLLSCFKQTEATFNLTEHGVPLRLELPTIVLKDVGVLGKSPDKDLTDLFKQYRISRIVEEIRKSSGESD